MKRLIQTIISLIMSLFNDLCNEISDGIEEGNLGKVTLNVMLLILSSTAMLLLFVLLIKWGIEHIHILVTGGLLIAALYSVYLKLIGHEEGNDNDMSYGSIEEEMALQEATEVHEELRTLVYNATVNTAETTPIRRVRDEYSIETSREKSFRMDGIMAVHQFEVDYDGTLDHSTLDFVLREFQRCMNKHARRYPFLVRDGRPPVAYDIKDAGGFLILEIVLYSEKYKDKLDTRKRARIAHRQKMADIYDRDF